MKLSILIVIHNRRKFQMFPSIYVLIDSIPEPNIHSVICRFVVLDACIHIVIIKSVGIEIYIKFEL